METISVAESEETQKTWVSLMKNEQAIIDGFKEDDPLYTFSMREHWMKYMYSAYNIQAYDR